MTLYQKSMFPQPAMFQVGFANWKPLASPWNFSVLPQWPNGLFIRDGRVSNKMRSRIHHKIPCLSQNPIKAIKYQVSITFSNSIEIPENRHIFPSNLENSLTLRLWDPRLQIVHQAIPRDIHQVHEPVMACRHVFFDQKITSPDPCYGYHKNGDGWFD